MLRPGSLTPVSVKAAVRDGVVRTLAPVADRAFRERPRVRVVCFHDIDPDAGSRFPDRMRWLADRYHVVSLASAYERVGLDRSRLNIALTFDDGYAEHAAFAAPVLRELGLPATFFVPSGALDLSPDEAERFAATAVRRTSRAFRFMTSAQVAELAAEPLFEIGAHTRHHVELGTVRESDALADEVGGAKARLEQLIGGALRWFAFPFGGVEHVSGAAVQAIAGAGFDAAFTIMPGYWSTTHDRYLVGRDSLGIDLSDETYPVRCCAATTRSRGSSTDAIGTWRPRVASKARARGFCSPVCDGHPQARSCNYSESRIRCGAGHLRTLGKPFVAGHEPGEVTRLGDVIGICHQSCGLGRESGTAPLARRSLGDGLARRLGA